MSGGFARARLSARPVAGAEAVLKQAQAGGNPGGGGLQELSLQWGSGGGGARRQAPRTLLYVPATYRPGVPAPLILTLHGAGGDAQGGLSHLINHADTYSTLLLSPESKGSTWDMLCGGYGPDVELINRALEATFEQARRDCSAASRAVVVVADLVTTWTPTHRVCASGFSDGASYALSIGTANGDLFTHVAAFSPGFMRPPVTVGRPLVYVSHGLRDRVLRIDYCSRRLVPRLEAQGYSVQCTEFDGPHSVPTSIAKEALDWFVSRRVQPGTSED